MRRICNWTALVWSLLGAFQLASAAAPDPEQVRLFESRVRPILATRCFRCHSEEKQKGELRLDSREGLAAGGSSGPAIVAGKPDESLLISAIGYANEELQMPPGEKLPDREIAELRRWVAEGAAFPAVIAAPADSGKDFWAFQPPREPALPQVKDQAWPKSPLDRFILAKLEEQNLHPAPPADKRTLLRRATYDLTGLPPAPEEVDAFLADESPEAFAKAIERLLDSPHYGERWGRHWLDIARYADSNGLDENVAHGNAWRYRDYVVGAFNRDKPFEQFLLEQLAGDLLPPVDDLATKHERLVATGFLALGPKVLAEVDEQKMEMDIIDEQLDTFGRAVLGLTLGCARCHDHKFDPIPTEDYYSLAGILKSTRTMENFKKVARWNENPIPLPEDLARKAEHDRRVAEQKETIAKLIAAADAELKSAGAAPADEKEKDREARYSAETKAELKKQREALAALEKQAPEMPSAMGVGEAQPVDVAIHIRGNHLTLGAVAPRRFPRVLAGDSPPTLDAKQSGRLQLAEWLVRKDHPLTARVMVNRIWRWHFGQGIVRSTDNFGRLGEPPSHPELLDWLAVRFMESGWSIKAMHRLVMLSAAYQMSSTYDERAATVDPDNRLHWRNDARRLEAEEVRDALLAASGRLDRTLGGSLLEVKNRDYLFDHTSKDKTSYDTCRRSLYLPVIRNHLYDVFQLFDAPNGSVPEGNRVTTTVAPQALFMMNSDVAIQSSDALAKDLLARAELDDAARVNRLYALAYARPADAAEASRAQALLSRFDSLLAAGEPDVAKRRERSWALLCQVIFAANEFVYLK